MALIINKEPIGAKENRNSFIEEVSNQELEDIIQQGSIALSDNVWALKEEHLIPIIIKHFENKYGYKLELLSGFVNHMEQKNVFHFKKLILGTELTIKG